jgi:hypothetical protein
MILFDKEGETPLDDISGLKIKNITTRTELDVVEADNILDAFLNYTLSAEQLENITHLTHFFYNNFIKICLKKFGVGQESLELLKLP